MAVGLIFYVKMLVGQQFGIVSLLCFIHLVFGDVTNSTDCQAGHYKDVIAEECKPCQKGTFSPNGQKCDGCQPGIQFQKVDQSMKMTENEKSDYTKGITVALRKPILRPFRISDAGL